MVQERKRLEHNGKDECINYLKYIGCGCGVGRWFTRTKFFWAFGANGLLWSATVFCSSQWAIFLVSAFTVYSRTLGLLFYVKMYEIPRWENAMIINVLCYGFLSNDCVEWKKTCSL